MLNDHVAERAVLAGIWRYGSEAYYDIADMIDENTFTVDLNIKIFKCLLHLLRKNDTIKFDLPSFYLAATHFKIEKDFHKPSEAQHLHSITDLYIQITNVRNFAAKIRKLQIARILQSQLLKAQNKLEDITGEESIAHIFGIAEDSIFDLSGVLHDKEDNPILIGVDLNKYIQTLSENPVEQIGISTGFAEYDKAIGGGLRRGTVNIIAARPKVGKSVMCDCLANNIGSKFNIPTLYLDTEMLKEDHIHRILARISGIWINDIETGKFTKNLKQKILIDKAIQDLEKLPYYYKNISGRQFEDQLAIMRRWLIKDVGLNHDGSAKDCVILYDYLKLMSSDNISTSLQEYQILGFMMTTLHNFAVRYKVPIVSFLQTNRDGIKGETTGVASGSDRIVWLCSNFSIFKKKTPEEIGEDGFKNGNRKMVVVAARHGEGTEEKDYINYNFEGEIAKITEGKRKFTLQAEEEGFTVEEDNDNDIPFDDNEPERI